MENEELLIAALKNELQIEPSATISFQELQEKLTERISHLINNDFEALVNLLYTVDVNETRLRSLLKEHTNTAHVIAELIIERQMQKIKTRQEFKASRQHDADEEKW
jgi:hypothetical protein